MKDAPRKVRIYSDLDTASVEYDSTEVKSLTRTGDVQKLGGWPDARVCEFEDDWDGYKRTLMIGCDKDGNPNYL